LRAGKGSYYEGGIRVPLIVSWPNKVRARQDTTPVINADFYPTLAKLLNVDTSTQVLDGVDLSAIWFEDKPIANRSLYWHFPIYLQAYNPSADQSRDPLFRTRPGSALRQGKWKLLHFFEDDSYELYDLENDLGEHVNLATHLPAVVSKLSRELDDWRIATNAPIPTELNPTYDAEFTRKQTAERLMHVNKKL
jgi:arylsulfatase A-like enzyme